MSSEFAEGLPELNGHTATRKPTWNDGRRFLAAISDDSQGQLKQAHAQFEAAHQFLIGMGIPEEAFNDLPMDEVLGAAFRFFSAANTPRLPASGDR